MARFPGNSDLSERMVEGFQMRLFLANSRFLWVKICCVRFSFFPKEFRFPVTLDSRGPPSASIRAAFYSVGAELWLGQLLATWRTEI